MSKIIHLGNKELVESSKEIKEDISSENSMGNIVSSYFVKKFSTTDKEKEFQEFIFNSK